MARKFPRSGRGLCATLEQFGVEPPVGEVPEFEAEMPEKVEQGFEAVTEARHALEELEEDLEAAEDGVEELEEIDEGLGESLGEVEMPEGETPPEAEGISEPSAKIAEVAVESIIYRTKLYDAPDTVFTALEGFRTPGAVRITSTKVSREGVKEVLSKLRDKIATGVSTMVTAIVEQVGRILATNAGIKKKAQEAKAQLANLPKEMKEAKVSSASIGKAFGAEGAVSAKSVLAVLNRQHQVITSGLAAADAMANDAVGKTIGHVKALMTGKSNRDTHVAYAKALSSDAISAFGKFKPATKKDIEERVIYSVGPLVDGKTLDIDVSMPDDLGLGVRFGVTVVKGKGGEAAELPTLKPNEMGQILDAVLKLCDAVEQARKYAKSGETASKKFSSALDFNVAGEGHEYKFMNDAVGATTSALKAFPSLVNKTADLSVTAERQALQYVLLSMRQFGVKAAAEPAASEGEGEDATD